MVLENMNDQIVLIHLHLDFEEHLANLLRKWNMAQDIFEFIGIRPSHKFEHPLLTPGAISDDEASTIAARIRTQAGYSPDNGIIVFTEKRVYDDEFYQLFVGGREADEEPPNIAILSLQFLRLSYQEANTQESKFFRAIVSNIIFSIGIDVGLEVHGDSTQGCIMDFCCYMPDIEVGLAEGPKFCNKCKLKDIPKTGNSLLLLPEVFRQLNDIDIAERDVTEAILMRGQQYAEDTAGYEFDVALSFSGKDREYAERLSDELKRNCVKVFYDRSDQANLWGRNLQIHLADLYRVRSRYCIVLVSNNYLTSKWTKVEIEAALAHEFERGDTYILPIKLDDTELGHILPTRGFLDARQESVENIVELVKTKLSMDL